MWLKNHLTILHIVNRIGKKNALKELNIHTLLVIWFAHNKSWIVDSNRQNSLF